MASPSALSKLFGYVDSQVSPTPEQAGKEKALASRLKALLSRALPEADITFLGSSARDTGLKYDRDIDIFAAFGRALSEKSIVERTSRAARRAIRAKWIMRYAEHPYLQCEYEGYRVEVIPCFSIKPDQEIKSAVDRSPLHMEYLHPRLTAEQRRDVRVLKQLLKNAGIYGAQASVEGFSGYVCELLVLNYRSLAGLLQAASKWVPQVFIDIEGHYHSDEKELAMKFPSAPLVVVDVTDAKRNAAAALSADNLARFVTLCRAVISNPSKSLFFSKRPPASRNAVLAAMGRRRTHYICVRASAPDKVEDIIAPQLRKTASNFSAFLSRQGLDLVDHAYFLDGKCAYLVFEFAFDRQGPVRLAMGPPAYDEKSVGRFLSTRKGKTMLRGPFVKGGRVCVESASGSKAVDLVRGFLSRPALHGAASHLAKPLKKAGVFGGGKQVVACMSQDALDSMLAFVEKADYWLQIKR